MANQHVYDVNKPRFSLVDPQGQPVRWEVTWREGRFFNSLGYTLMRSVFDGKKFVDTVYLTAAPQQ
jgi:hypothetical protein